MAAKMGCVCAATLLPLACAYLAVPGEVGRRVGLRRVGMNRETGNVSFWVAAPLGVELYDHEGDDGTDADAFENVNVVDDHDDVRRELFEVLRRKFDDSYLSGVTVNVTLSNTELPRDQHGELLITLIVNHLQLT